MPSNRSDAQHEGFKAGGYFGGQCPYPPGSQEAAAWERGWLEGSVRRTATQRRQQRPVQTLLKTLRNLVPSAH